MINTSNIRRYFPVRGVDVQRWRQSISRIVPNGFVWLCAALVAVAAYGLLVQAAFDFTLDDVFISMRYADNLARHGELAWNPGEALKVEGYSNLLWVLLMSGLFRFVPADPFLATKVLSIVFGVATLVVFSLLAQRLMSHRLAVFFATLLVGVSAPYVLWACSGMENMLYLFLICLSLWLLVLEDERRQFFLVTPVVLFLIGLTRTEGVVFFASAFLVRLARIATDPACRQPQYLRRWMRSNFVFAVLFIGWMGWKLWHYGSIVPLPVYLKTADGGSGILYVRDFLVQYAPYVPLALVGGLLSLDLRKPSVHLAGSLILYLAAISVSNPIMGMHHRLILAAWPLIVLLAFTALVRQIHVLPFLKQTLAVGAIGLFLLHWEIGFPHLYRGRLRGLALNYHHFLEDLYIPLGQWFRQEREQVGELTVALHDAGATPFYGADCHIIDMLGLNDREFARTPMTPATLMAREPDYVVLKSRSVQRFENPDDGDYGSMSNLIHADSEFQSRYELDRVWSDLREVYVVWVYRRKPPQ